MEPETGEPIGDGNPALQDPAFRHALGYGDRPGPAIERVYQGAGKPGKTIVPTATPTGSGALRGRADRYDPEKAGEVLDEAGYKMGDDGFAPCRTARRSARSACSGAPKEGESGLQSMDFLKEWLAELGIESEVIAMETNKLTNTILEGEFDVFQWGWYVEPDRRDARAT